MLQNFLVEETIVRASGESSVFEIGSSGQGSLILTFGITHAVEHQDIHLAIHGSADGEKWGMRPLIAFPRKYYCGEYSMTAPRCGARYLKAVWSVSRWSRGGQPPYFRFYVFADAEGASLIRMAG